jgi:hypothetical protein
MKTAVEWLVEQLTEVERKNWINNKILPIGKNSLAKQIFDGIIEQANEMFEQQITNAWNNGYREFYDGSSTPEEYYKETFKSE